MRIALTFLAVIGLSLMFVAMTAQLLLALRTPASRPASAEIAAGAEAPASWWHGRR
jgi:hypothetical protein